MKTTNNINQSLKFRAQQDISSRNHNIKNNERINSQNQAYTPSPEEIKRNRTISGIILGSIATAVAGYWAVKIRPDQKIIKDIRNEFSSKYGDEINDMLDKHISGMKIKDKKKSALKLKNDIEDAYQKAISSYNEKKELLEKYPRKLLIKEPIRIYAIDSMQHPKGKLLLQNDIIKFHRNTGTLPPDFTNNLCQELLTDEIKSISVKQEEEMGFMLIDERKNSSKKMLKSNRAQLTAAINNMIKKGQLNAEKMDNAGITKKVEMPDAPTEKEVAEKILKNRLYGINFDKNTSDYPWLYDDQFLFDPFSGHYDPSPHSTGAFDSFLDHMNFDVDL